MQKFTYNGFTVKLVEADTIAIKLRASKLLKPDSETFFKDGSRERNSKRKCTIDEIKDIKPIDRVISIELISIRVLLAEKIVPDESIQKIKKIIDLFDADKETFKPEFFKLDTKFLESDRMNVYYGDLESEGK